MTYWKIKHADTIGNDKLESFKAYFPQWHLGTQNNKDVEQPKYIKIDGAGHSAILKTIVRKKAATDDSYRVTTSTAKEIPDGTTTLIEPSTASQYYRYLIKNDQSTRIALWGLIIAVIGSLVKAAYEILKGNGHTFTDLESNVIQIIVVVFVIVGLLLTFWKGLIDKK